MTLRFHGVDLDAHLRHFRYVGQDRWQVVITADNHIAASSHPDGADLLLSLVDASGIELPPESVTTTVRGAHTLWILPITDHLHTPIGAVVVSGATDSFPANSGLALETVVETLTRDVRLNLELAEMADELNRRHEELNLIYSINATAETEGSDEEQLQHIVDHVLEHMDGDLVLISVPSRKIWTIASSETGRPFTHPSLLKKSETIALDWMRRHGAPLVINDRLEDETSELNYFRPFRTLVVPVLDEREEVIGGLSLSRFKTRPRLVNSDKNLLLTLSGRVTKLIQNSFDTLTGLPRRARFEAQLQRTIEDQGTGSHQHTLILVNVDGMSAINQHFGVLSGDSALALVGARIAGFGRQQDFCCRLGEDEFAVLLRDCDEAVAVRKVVDLQKELAREPFMTGNTRHILRISAGVVSVGAHMTTVEALTKASVVCGIAKEAGGNSVEAFGKAAVKVSAKREELRVLTQVRRALEEDRFVLYAQEIRALQNANADPHFEVLIRLFDEDGKMIPPNDFIPTAEKHHIMPAIDSWVITNVLKQLRHSNLLSVYPQSVCSINLSGQSFVAGGILENVEKTIREQRVPPENICFEVTETAAIADLAAANFSIARVRRLGCRFALDDFGAGLSSFSYLRSLPLDYVKIDGSFVRDICTDHTARVMVTAIHNVGKSMGLCTVAEYVEDQAIIDALTEIGVDYGQGYGIGKPMPLADYLDLHMTGRQQRHG